MSQTVGGDGGSHKSGADPPRLLRVLVVDDHRDSATSLAMVLDLMGHLTRTAYDGPTAIDAAEQFLPDVIFLDLALPKLDGYDTCRRIRAELWGRSMMIIALTGRGGDEDRRRSAEAGFALHLVKPVDPDELERLLTEVRAAEA